MNEIESTKALAKPVAPGVTKELAQLGQATPCSEQVGHREGRIEPRKNKRRPKLIALMTKPRHAYQAEMGAAV